MSTFIDEGQTYNATIITREVDGTMWVVPTADHDEASEMADDYAPQNVRALSGAYHSQPIFHPCLERIRQTSGS